MCVYIYIYVQRSVQVYKSNVCVCGGTSVSISICMHESVAYMCIYVCWSEVICTDERGIDDVRE